MISKRLRTLSTLVPLNSVACDIAKGPLQQAEKTISEAGCSAQIQTILCPGFSKVPSDANCMIIAGMGWKTIEMILENDYDRLSQFDRILLQSNRDVNQLRAWVSEHHMTIVEEKVVEDMGKDYEIVCITNDFNEGYTLEEIKYGPVLLKRKDQEFLEFLDRKIKKNELIASKVTDEHKKNQILSEIDEMKQIRQR